MFMHGYTWELLCMVRKACGEVATNRHRTAFMGGLMDVVEAKKNVELN